MVSRDWVGSTVYVEVHFRKGIRLFKFFDLPRFQDGYPSIVVFLFSLCVCFPFLYTVEGFLCY